MDVTKLRIGNKLLLNEETICNVLEIRNSYLRVNYIRKDNGLEHTSLVEIDRFKPIPLTEKILSENCNFVLYKGWDDQHYWCLPSDKEKSNRFELLEVDNGFLLPSDKKIEFLHQLQNCYYFHSLKEELIVNL